MSALNPGAGEPLSRWSDTELTRRRPHWPPLNRSLVYAACGFIGAVLAVTLLVQLGRLHSLDLRVLAGVQRRASLTQDFAFGVLSYLGGIEISLVLAGLLGLRLFKGFRFLALGPVVIVLLASGMEALGKLVIHQPAPPLSALRFPSYLPHLNHTVGTYSFPSGHVLRSVILYGLLLYFAQRWQLFGKEAARLAPALLLLIGLIAYAVLYLGWHWFADALGGGLLGAGILLGCIAFLERRWTVIGLQGGGS
jgi:undecaprenyl-diphosphatase